jgi:hypothetical protein
VRSKVRIALAAVVGAVVLLGEPAGAQVEPTPSITVTPSTGLVDGQVVSITGTGFAGMNSVAPLECPPQFGGRTEFGINEVLTNCNFIAFAQSVVIDAAGNLTASAPVRETFTPSSGGPAYDCTVRNDCVLLVAGLGGFPELRGASVPIRFGPAEPGSKAACKGGGWRTLANDQGRPFRNQGACVSFVVRRR